MDIDLTALITSSVEELSIDGMVCIPEELVNTSEIRRLKDIKFVGKIIKLCDGNYQIVGTLSGIMVLPDDITLEDVDVSFVSEIEENINENSEVVENNLEIIQNRLDITEFLWQNILVEIPTKVVCEENRDLTLEGNGWRFVTEDELERSNNSPFSELSSLLDSRKE